MIQLWRLDKSGPITVRPSTVDSERLIEDWLASNPEVLDQDLLIIQRQLTTAFGGRIDLLGIRADGSLVLLELKRHKGSRDLVGQALDYASWVRQLTPRDVVEYANQYFEALGKKSFASEFKAKFGVAVPETLDASHSIVLVAAEIDDATQRIVRYLSEDHGMAINTAFFSCFDDDGRRYLASNWLLDQQEVSERQAARDAVPWSGYYYVNVVDDNVRSWEDMRKYGFVAAGYGRQYSGRLDQLEVGNEIFVYHRGRGYLGFGTVISPAAMSKDFVTSEGRKLSELSLAQPAILHDADDADLADYIVGVKWAKAVPLSEAAWQQGLFANQNVVCKLRHPATVDFLKQVFPVEQK